jgi:hypothetical protein
MDGMYCESARAKRNETNLMIDVRPSRVCVCEIKNT